MLLEDLMLTKDELLEIAKKQYPGRPEIIRMLVLADLAQTVVTASGKGQIMDEVIELSASGETVILLSVRDGRITGLAKRE